MSPESAAAAVLIVVSLPVLVALKAVHLVCQRRAIHATDRLVVTTLLLKRSEGELEISRASLRERLAAVRDHERHVHGAMPAADHPERLETVVGPAEARRHLRDLRERVDDAERRAGEQRVELKRHLEARRERLHRANRRLRAVSRSVAVSAALVRALLGVAVLYALAELLLDLYA
ncbi:MULTISPECIES: hypothetical protein [unclassified Nocardiopsis]|uniref:hypothetical protein n=1 Tax=unclassified Nocardiopsis TaxID=2649073 RepID=UPI0033E54804